MGKKTSRPSAKVGTAASPAEGLAGTSSKSSILRSAFSPSEYQLALFASVIQGLDAQHLRIHDVNTGRLQCEHALGPKETVTSLDWGYFGGKSRDQKKKRKRGSDVNGSVDGLDQGDVVVAIGTSTSDIRMFSPSEDKIVGTLTGAHDKGIKDFKFTAEKPAQEAWSIGGDNKLVQWDLRTGQSVRTINLPASSTFTALSRPISSNTPVVCASQTPFLIDVENSEEQPVKFPAMRNQIHTVISSSGSFLAADGERFINVFETSSQKLVRNLVAEQDVSSVSLLDNTIPEKQILAAVTDDGTIELFTKPFAPAPTATTSAKANRKQMTQKANASLKVLRSGDSEACVPVVSTSFVGPEIVVAYAEGGVIPVFQRVKLLDETTEELSFTGLKAVIKTKSSSAVASATLNGAKNVSEGRVDETHVVVEAGNIVDNDVEMNDDDEAGSASGSDVDSDVEESAKPTSEKKTKSTKQTAPVDEDVDMGNAASEDEDEEEEEGAEPSFGEIMRANAGQEVDVEAEMDEDNLMGALVPGKPTAAIQQIPTGVSLATVLTQSLKTNDKDMLESCFHTADTSIIRTTIQRLESPLAATLLQKLAERLSSRPGRYGHLLVWVQWTCVAHGGALAGHPELLNRMATLYKVMDQRSSSLPSLLLLKGKLDMLDAQLGLRQSIRGGDEMDSEDEDNVIYVEGQDDEEDDDEAKPRTKSIRDSAFEEDEDESMMNGIADESDDDEDEDDEDDEDGYEGVLDIEAEESAGSSDAEESLEENEDDEDEDSEGSLADFVADTEDEDSDDEMVEAPPPSKKAKTTAGRKKGGKK